MPKIYKALSVLSLALFVISLGALQIDVTGEWELTTQTQRGEMTRTVKFVQEGEKLTVTMEGMRGGEVTGEGTVQGSKIEWTITRSTPQGEMTIAYKGTVEGDTMSGTAQMGNFGETEWTAKRK